MEHNPNCKLCDLYKGRNHVCVPGRGSMDSSILLVGQAPGRIEDGCNTVFAGPSGELMDYMVSFLGLGDVRYENVVCCWPPGDRVPTAHEVKACSPYLLHTISCMRNLKVIVALGNVALKFLTGKAGITKRAGEPVEVLLEGRHLLVLPCYHPSYIIRTGDDRLGERFQDILASIPTIMHGVDSTFVRLLKGVEAYRKIKKFINNKHPVAFDFETTGLDPTVDSVISVSFYRGRKKQAMKPVSCLVDIPITWFAIRDFLQSSTPKIYHTVFEWAWAKYHFGVELCNPECDTAILSWRDDSDRSVRLSMLTSAYVPEVSGFKVDSNTALEEGEQWWSMDRVTLQTRNAIDAYATWWAWKRLSKKLGPKVMKTHKEVDLPISFFVRRMQERGIVIDTKKLLELEKKHEAQARRELAKARRVGIHALLSSPKQLSDNFKELGLDTGTWGKPDRHTGKTYMSTSKDALLDLVEAYPHTKRWVNPILEHRRCVKFKGTYVKGVAKNAVRSPDLAPHLRLVRGRIWFPGTVTGRLSSSAPNRLNFPRGEFREIFCSRYEGGTIVSADYSQLELRVLAALSKDPVMEDIYLHGKDIHDTTAIHFFGKGYTKNQRVTAKSVNFLIVYGGGPHVMRLNLRKMGIIITDHEAKEFIEAWKRLYVVAWNYMQSLQTDAMVFKKIMSPSYYIERHFSEGRSLKKTAKEGANMPIQCGAAMMTLHAGEKLDKELDGTEGLVVNLVHDEIVVDCPGDGLQVAAKVRDSMIWAAEQEPWMTLPVEVDVRVGPTWGTGVSLS